MGALKAKKAAAAKAKLVKVEEVYEKPIEKKVKVYEPTYRKDYVPVVKKAYKPVVKKAYKPVYKKSYRPVVRKSYGPYGPVVKKAIKPVVTKAYKPVVRKAYRPVVKKVVRKPVTYGRDSYVRNYQRSYDPVLKPRYPERGLPEIDDLPSALW